MKIALGVDRPDVVADQDRSAGEAGGKLVLLPDRRSGRLVERVYGALVVGDVEVAAVGGDAAEAGEVARPDQRAANDVETGDAALIRGSTCLALLDDRHAGDVGDALELGRALGRGNARFPAEHAAGNVERQQLASSGSGEKRAAADGAAGKTAHRQRRVGALKDPFLAAVRIRQGVDAPVERPYDDLPFGGLRRTGNFGRYLD